MTSLLLVLGALAAPPSPAVARAGANLAGAPWAAEELHRVGYAESRNKALGVHKGPNAPGRVFYFAAQRAGWLTDCNPRAPEEWGPRGTYGLVAAYHVRHLGECVAPEALDIPLVSAYLAARAWEELRRRGFCDYQARRTAYKRGAQHPDAKKELERCKV